MAQITTVDALRALYRPAAGRAVDKVLDRLDVHCRRFVELSPFLLLSSADRRGHADLSPRGGDPGFVHCLDDRRLGIPDAPGNNRLDTLTNLLENPEAGLLFTIPGVDETLRVNGTAEILDDEALRLRFAAERRPPVTVIVVTVREAYLHCAKAIMRARLWDPEARQDRSVLPTMGRMLKDQIGYAEPAESQEEMVRRYKEVLY